MLKVLVIYYFLLVPIIRYLIYLRTHLISSHIHGLLLNVQSNKFRLTVTFYIIRVLSLSKIIVRIKITQITILLFLLYSIIQYLNSRKQSIVDLSPNSFLATKFPCLWRMAKRRVCRPMLT